LSGHRSSITEEHRAPESHAPPTGEQRTPTAGYVLALVSSFGGGAATALGKWNLESISPLLMNAMIFSVATVLLSIWVWPKGGLGRIRATTRRGWFWTAMFSLSSWLAVMGYWAGIQQMDPTLASFLNRSEVLVAILLGMIFLGERFNRIETAGAVISFIGIIIMRLTLRVEYSLGFWLVLVGSLFFGITELVSKIAVRHVEPVVLTYIRNAFLAVTYWVVFWLIGYSFAGLDRVWIGVVVVGFLGPILSRLCYVMALKKMELSKVAVISQMPPVWVMLLAVTFLGQFPTAREIFGGVFLIGGTLLMVVGRRPGWRSRLVENELPA